MPIYELLAQNNYAIPRDTPATAADNTVGAALMEMFAQRHYTWPEHAEQILDAFHNHMEMFWTWNPSHTAGTAAQLLDGVRTQAACGQLARAFLDLLRSPAPYGFGVPVVTGTYTYEPTGQTFISRHPGELFGLKPNILRHNWATHPSPWLPLYNWGNHVVVRHEGRYYDPCYNTIYDPLTQIARYQVTLNGRMVDKKLVVDTAEAIATNGTRYTFANVLAGSPARVRFPLASLIAPEGLPD